MALVTGDDFVAVIRGHADAVHDVLRRRGVPLGEAAALVESTAVSLLDTLVNAADTVGDLAGGWFGAALSASAPAASAPAASAPAASAPAASDAGDSSATDFEQRLTAAFAAVPERERLAVLLHDSRALSLDAVAIALQLSTAAAADLVMSGRLRLLAAYPPGTAALEPHPAAEGPSPGALARLADGETGSGLRRDHRHVEGCARCRRLVDGATQARNLAAGLPVLGMPEAARVGLLARIGARAGPALPSYEEVALATDEADAPILTGRVVTAVAAAAVAAALIVAYATRGGNPGAAASPFPSSVVPTVRPSTTAHSRSRSPSPTPSTAPSVQATASSAAPSASSVAPSSAAKTLGPVTLSDHPAQGPPGQVITVTGTGWHPGVAVVVRFLDRAGQATSTSTAIADASGRIHATVTATDPEPLPGQRTIEAGNGAQSASASFTLQL